MVWKARDQMIDVHDLSYTYHGNTKKTLKNISFQIGKGEIFGFLGPSGAGKSTTQKVLFGLLKDYKGSVQLLNKEVSHWESELYQMIGVSFEFPNHYINLTAKENLEYFGSLYQGKCHPIEEVLSWVGLEEDSDKRVSNYSKGMKVRLNIARSILHKPKILFLDEPTAGLDPVNAKNITDLILRLRDQGATIFITTHNMSVAEKLCDRVAFITKGEIRIEDEPEKLKKKYGRRFVRVKYLVKDETSEREFPMDGLGENDEFLSLLRSMKKMEAIHSQETTLEDVFIHVTGEELE